MKPNVFQMRMSDETKAKLEQLKKHYNLSGASVMDMLIADKTRAIITNGNETIR